jgi:hypothetical protein
MEDPRICGRLMLKWILKKLSLRVSPELIWLRIDSIGRHLWHGIEASCFIKVRNC